MNENMNTNNTIPQFRMGHTIEGFVKVGCVDPDGSVTWQEWQRNLMLNQGMNLLASYGYADVMYYGTAGTGSRVNKFDSGGSEVSQSGTLLGLSGIGTITDWTGSADGGNYTAMLQPGDVIQFADGTEVMVASTNNAVMATAFSSSQVVAAQPFVIYKTSQTNLHGTRKLSATYVAGQNGTTNIKNTVTYWRTYDFTAEVAPNTYSEVGVSDYFQTQINRVLLDTPITIPIGSQLRLTFNMNISIYPSASVYYPTDMITGWPGSAGTASVQQLLFKQIQSDGTIFDGRNFGTEPSSPQLGGFVSSHTGSVGELLLTGGTPYERTNLGQPSIYYAGSGFATTNTYRTNTFSLDRTASFSVSQGSSSFIRSIGFGDQQNNGTPGYSSRVAWAYLMNQSQSKNDLQTLSFAWCTSWRRVLD